MPTIIVPQDQESEEEPPAFFAPPEPLQPPIAISVAQDRALSPPNALEDELFATPHPIL
jgi:hypothetical protein